VTASRRELNVSALISGYYDEDPCRIGCRRLFVLFGAWQGPPCGCRLRVRCAAIGLKRDGRRRDRMRRKPEETGPRFGFTYGRKLYARELQVRTERRMGSGRRECRPNDNGGMPLQGSLQDFRFPCLLIA